LILPEINPVNSSDWINSPPELLFNTLHKLWKLRIKSISLFKENQHFIFDRSFFTHLAYFYAYDKQNATCFFNKQLKLHNRDLDSEYFSSIIILITSVENSIKRKKELFDSCQLKKELAFLQNFQEFYLKILPNIISPQNIKIIDTDILDKNNTQKAILTQICSSLTKKQTQKHFIPNYRQISKIKMFAKQNNLGLISSNPLTIRGIPTIYYEKHCVQLNTCGPVFLDHKQLKILAYT